MRDCPDVEMRELLPAAAAGTLRAGDADRVHSHVAGCADCRQELQLLRAARAILRRSPTLRVSQVASAVASATSAERMAIDSVPVARAHRRFPGWRAAASIAVLAVAVTSLGVWKVANAPGVADAPAGALAGASTPEAPPSRSSGPEAELMVGDVGGLDDGELETLLAEVGSFDAASFGEPESALPYIDAAGEGAL